MGEGRVSLTPCPDFYRPVEELEYTDLLRSTFTQSGHERGFKPWRTPATHPQCVFCDKKYRWGKGQMDHGVKTDIWSVMEDFSKSPGDQDFSNLKSQYSLFVDALGSKQVFQYVYHMRLWITVSIVTDNIVYVVSF
jgi:hypothetical protein